jgi:D-sedoheptulose 7-phosphate isomerase|tara:strand:+ start:2024 stop:2551 length:528 start_codon:yes stop_codon:yes gene_type:complete
MQIDIYNKFYQEYFVSENFKSNFDIALNTISKAKNIFFIGNGGSMAICSHMMEDYAKIGKFRTHAFSDPSLITCYANDYGYDHALKEWLKIYFEPNDLLVAISSSGNSQNIINAVSYAQEQGGQVIGLSGFKPDNKLNSSTYINFYLGIENYGVVECFHQVILHALLDEYASKNG